MSPHRKEKETDTEEERELPKVIKESEKESEARDVGLGRGDSSVLGGPGIKLQYR